MYAVGKRSGETDFPYIQVESSLQAVKDLAAYYLEQLQIPVVGITGSVGKTSTKEMIAAVLAQKYRVLKTQGNFNNELGTSPYSFPSAGRRRNRSAGNGNQ